MPRWSMLFSDAWVAALHLWKSCTSSRKKVAREVSLRYFAQGCSLLFFFQDNSFGTMHTESWICHLQKLMGLWSKDTLSYDTYKSWRHFRIVVRYLCKKTRLRKTSLALQCYCADSVFTEWLCRGPTLRSDKNVLRMSCSTIETQKSM